MIIGIDGFLVVDKPGGMTSRKALNLIQRTLPRKTKIGHTGTLDPLATGVLVLCLGKATKMADTVQAMTKVYRTDVRLGATSTTDDADGDVTETADVTPVSESQIRELLPSFVGTISQLPPAFSALKVDGRRAYDLARSGQDVELKPRDVRVDRVELLKYEWPMVTLEIQCGKGTYIRSIARDLGRMLDVGGMVQTLRRTRVGPWLAEQGVGVDADEQSIKKHLIPIAALDAVKGKADDTCLPGVLE